MVGESRKKDPPRLLDARAEFIAAAHCAVCATRGVISAKKESGVIRPLWSSGVRGSRGEGGEEAPKILLARVELQSENWLVKAGRGGRGSSSTSITGVDGRDGSRFNPKVRSVVGAASLSRHCVNVNRPSA
jgi:hypothetical protein